MATKNIVPRTAEEGQIGTTAKKWLKGYFKELYMGSTPAKCSVEGHSHSVATVSDPGLVELATDAEFDTGTDTGRVASVKQIRKRVPLGFKNLLINGAFFVNQRVYVSGTATTAANQYTLDRWRVVTSGEALSWTSSAGTVTVTAPAGGIEQVVEGATLQSGTYAISWTGTATCMVGWTTRTNGESFSLTGGSNVTVKFINGTVANAQLELGGCATPFERRPYGLELALCQWYFQRFSLGATKPFTLCRAVNSIGAGFFVPMLPMRAAPTVALSNLAAYFSSEQIPAAYQVHATANVCYVYVSGLSGLTQGQSGAILAATGCTGELSLSAEL